MVKRLADDRRVLVDYGAVAAPHISPAKLGRFYAIVYTHGHIDHLVPDAAVAWLDAGVPVHGNADVASIIGDDRVQVFEPGETVGIAGFQVQTYNLPHCLMVDGSTTPTPNTGLLFDQELLLPGDSTIVPDSLIVKAVAVPIWGPDITFKDAVQMVDELHAEIMIPVHYDVVGMNPHGLNIFGVEHGRDLRILENGESTEL